MAKQFQVDTGGTLTTSLISYYKLDDETDFYGSNNLTNVGSAMFVAGKVGNCVNLDGSTQYLKNATNYGIDGGSISIAAWVYLAANSSDYQAFTHASNNTSDIDEWFLYRGATTQLEYERLKGGISDDRFNATVTLSTSTWYHIVLTYNGTTLEGWKNGASQGTVASSGNGSADRGIGLWIGADRANATLWNGRIDELGIWSKKLSNTEIADLYNAGNGQTMIFGPVGRSFQSNQSVKRSNSY